MNCGCSAKEEEKRIQYCQEIYKIFDYFLKRAISNYGPITLTMGVVLFCLEDNRDNSFYR